MTCPLCTPCIHRDLIVTLSRPHRDMTIGCIWDKHGKALLSMSITPNVIRVIVEGELVPATGLALGGGPPNNRSRSYPRHICRVSQQATPARSRRWFSARGFPREKTAPATVPRVTAVCLALGGGLPRKPPRPLVLLVRLPQL